MERDRERSIVDRLDDIEAAAERLLDEHAAARSRLHDLEAAVGDSGSREERAARSPTHDEVRDVTRDESRTERTVNPDGQEAVRSVTDGGRDEATQAEVERAVREQEDEDREFTVA